VDATTNERTILIYYFLVKPLKELTNDIGCFLIKATLIIIELKFKIVFTVRQANHSQAILNEITERKTDSRGYM
jgi:hypothetical protein